MGKRILTACLAVMMAVGVLSPSASAASPVGQATFTDGDYTFTRSDITISGVGIGYELLFDGSSGGQFPEDNIYFSDGLLLVQDSKNDSFVYLGEDGKIHDLNQGRFSNMFPFSEGLAAVIDKDGMGFIDTTGKLVIPCQFTYTRNQIGGPFGSLFHDGKAWTFRYDNSMDMYGNQKGIWTQIDKTGKLLTDTAVPTTMDVVRGPSAKDEKTYGVFCTDGATHGASGFSEVCSAPTIGTFKARFGTSDTGLTDLPTGKIGANGNEETFLYVVKRKPLKNELSILIENSEDTDPDGRQTYTITNNTGKQVNGYYALLSYWPKTSWYPAVTEEKEGWYGTSSEHEYFRGQLMSFDVTLAPGKSMTGNCYSTATGWSTMNHVWITFDDAAERDAILKNDALGSQQFDYYYDIDMAEKGIKWMKDTFGITIESGKAICFPS